MTAEEGARELYKAGRLYQLEELAKTLELTAWLRLLRAHRRCAAAEYRMAACRDERLHMDRAGAKEHPAEIEEQEAQLQLLSCLYETGVLRAGKQPYQGTLQMLLQHAVRIHSAAADACPEYLA